MIAFVRHLVVLSLFLSSIASSAVAEPRCPFEALKPPTEATHFAEDQQTLRDIRQKKGEERKQALLDYSAPRAKTNFERALVIFDWAMAAILGTVVVRELAADPHRGALALVLAIPTLYVADVIGQIFHKALDSYISENNRFLGTGAREFRKHHEDPNNLNRVPTLDHLVAFAKPMSPAFAAAAAAAATGNLDAVVGAELWVGMMALLHATEFHKQAHLKQPNWFFGILQKLRLAVSHEEHMSHHKPPFDGEYGIINGWSNAGIRRIGLWHRLDQLFWKYRGRMPHNWVQDPRSIPITVMRELQAEFDKIPPELWHSAATNPDRLPQDLKAPVAQAEAKWQTHFVRDRRALYHELIAEKRISFEEAEKKWLQEQQQFRWLYGGKVHPLIVNH